MTENEKPSSSDRHEGNGKDPSAEFVREFATSAPPKSVEAVKAASDLVDLDARVKRRAYELWEQAGRPEDQHEAYWLKAEEELADDAPNEDG